MRILVYVKMWNGHGGAEQSMRTLANGLAASGHEYIVFSGDDIIHPQFARPKPNLAKQIKLAKVDVVLTQLKWSENLSQIRDHIDVPVVQFIRCGIPPASGLIHIFNSKWNKKRHGGKGIVLYPPLNFKNCRVNTSFKSRRFVTMMSTSHHKGGDMLKKLAAAMSDIPFLGITGFGGTQVKDFGKSKNLTLRPKVVPEKVYEIYGETRVMVLPARHESFGRTVVEALYNGIPVISSNKPGVKEAGSRYVTFVKNYNDIDEWAKKIREAYELPIGLSRGAVRYVERFDQENIIGELETYLTKILGRK